MSPRRKVEPGSKDVFRMPEPQPRRWVLGLVAVVSAVAVLAAVAVSALVLVKRETQRRDLFRDAAAIQTVSGFMTLYTSPDPFHANAYADKVLALGTGNFAKLYSDKMTEVVIQVAQAEPGVGAVQEIGIERWNPDDSVNVIAAANMTTTMPDGKKIDSGSRWEVTAVKEGDQWKVSDLIQVL